MLNELTAGGIIFDLLLGLVSERFKLSLTLYFLNFHLPDAFRNVLFFCGVNDYYIVLRTCVAAFISDKKI